MDIQLSSGSKGLVVSALVDSGASLNILPFDVGIELGLIWEQQTFPIDLGGVLQDSQAYGVLLKAQIADLEPTQLAFAWVNKSSSEVRTLLGQVNFFQEYDVHFYGNQQFFEIDLKTD
ncbi:MAG: hypothetical protein KC445_11295 [Anaerolineales bacterium]|nr:hypothetical protein [Anaerolineales bacterium]MCA9918530.1 hypothetical protein [Anaerolineales bacterium]